MPKTVAVFGATGSLGRAVIAALKKSHTTGHVKLVVLHRPSSNLASLNLPSDVATRLIDLESHSDDEAQVSSLRDLDVIMYVFASCIR
jgi:uncharacterized protein YbjT (DUF2867 family)